MAPLGLELPLGAWVWSLQSSCCAVLPLRGREGQAFLFPFIVVQCVELLYTLYRVHLVQCIGTWLLLNCLVVQKLQGWCLSLKWHVHFVYSVLYHRLIINLRKTMQGRSLYEGDYIFRISPTKHSSCKLIDLCCYGLSGAWSWTAGVWSWFSKWKQCVNCASRKTQPCHLPRRQYVTLQE